MELKLRDYQQEIIDKLYENNNNGINRNLVMAGTGAGKCHGRDTKILMFDGTIKNIQDVKVGDLLMGDDSMPREVLSLARGRDEMYKITPTKGDSWTCNSKHELVLVSNSKKCGLEKDQVIEIEMKDYLALNKTSKHVLKQFRVGVDYSHQNVTLEPYMLGLWLAEGTSRSAEITNPEPEVKKYCEFYARKHNDNLRVHYSTSGCPQYYFSSKVKHNRGTRSYLLGQLQHYNLICNKHIPLPYLVGTRGTRLQVLAGLIDGDGYLTNNCLEITQKSLKLAQNILQLCRSLGLAAYSTEKIVNGETYYRISISGDLSVIPNKVKRKKAEKRQQIKSVLRTGFTVESLGEQDYYGVTVDGNRRYLLADFTVTHNSMVIAKLALDASLKRKKVLIVAHRTKLVQQLSETINSISPFKVGEIRAGKKVNYNHHYVFVAMAQTLQARQLPPDIDLLLIDECHAVSYLSVFEKMMDKYFGQVWALSKTRLVGLTATPWRGKKKEGFCRWFQQTVKAPSPGEMISNGYLTPAKCYSYDIEGFEDLKESANGDYTLSSLTKVCNEEYNQDVVDKYCEGFKELKAIAFTSTVNQAIDLAKKFTDAGLYSKHIDGTMSDSERDELYKAFKLGSIRVLVSVITLTTGYDETSIEAVILARPTRSVSLFVQMVGRGLRLHPGKEHVHIIDFGNCFHSIKKVQGQPIVDHIDISFSRLCPVNASNPFKVEMKTCPMCETEMLPFARFCPNCEHEFVGQLKPKPERIVFPELVPFMTVEGYRQYNWLRKFIVRKFERRESPLTVFAEYNKNFHRLPPDDFFLGAIFHLDNSEVNYRKYKEYLIECGVKPREGLKFFELEFGKVGRTYEIKNQEYQSDERLELAFKKLGINS